MTAPVTPPAPQGDPVTDLPAWTDAPAVATYLASVAAFAVGIVAMLHPGFTEPALVQALIPTASVLIAGAVQAVHIIAHRGVQKAAIVARTAKR